MATPKAQASKGMLSIKPIETQTYRIPIIGDTELIVHAWSEKAKKEMADKQSGKPTPKKKEARDPQAEYEASFYRMPDGGYGFPSIAFKAAVAEATRYTDGLTKAYTYGSFYVVGELIPIIGTPHMRTDMVRLGGISRPADLRYRPGFPEWSTVLTVKINEEALSLEFLLNMLNQAGFAIGVGEWRTDGSYGRFHVGQNIEVVNDSLPSFASTNGVGAHS